MCMSFPELSMYIQCLKKKEIQLKKKPHPLIDLRENMPEKPVIFFVRPCDW